MIMPVLVVGLIVSERFFALSRFLALRDCLLRAEGSVVLVVVVVVDSSSAVAQS